MSKRHRQSRSIRARGVGRNVSARGQGVPMFLTINAAVEDCYSETERRADFAGLPDAATPRKAEPRAAFKQKLRHLTLTQEMIDSQEMREMRQFMIAHGGGNRDIKALPGHQRVQNFWIGQPRKLELGVFLPEVEDKDPWDVDVKAEADRHAAFIAKERADMVARRNARLLGLAGAL